VSLHNSMSQKAIFKRISRDQTTGEPLPLKKLLENEMFTARSLMNTGIPARVKEGKRRLAEAHEQLRILKSFDPRIVRLMKRVAIRNFREQTRRMKAGAS
jgi:hypothetical protein